MSIRKILLLFIDFLLINLSFIVALLLKFDSAIPAQYLTLYQNTFFIFSLLSISTFIIFHLYRSLWCYAGFREIFQVIFSILVSDVLFAIYTHFFIFSFPFPIYIIYFLLACTLIGGVRISYRLIRRVKNEDYLFPAIHTITNRILIVGAGDAAALIIKETLYGSIIDSKIIVAVDDNPYKQQTKIHCVPIKGTTHDIPALVYKYQINKILIAIPSASKKRIAEILTICNETSCKLEIFPGIQNSLTSRSYLNNIRPVNIEDLLGREEISLDHSELTGSIKDKVVLVTGAGGSIGSELCRQLSYCHPKKLILLDIYENNVYELQQTLLSAGFPEDQLEVIIGSVRDAPTLHKVFSQFEPHIVFHAAAHKHVPLMEKNPAEALKNNIYGTLNTALCAKEFGTAKFILISTDKAVNPTNIMGASKRICEMIIQGLAFSNDCRTCFAAVRFGNVLGSNGSVIPLFKRQLEAGGPLTVTDPHIVRYFMTIPEAVHLILKATTLAKGGEIFVLDMGQPVKIMDLAKNYIKLSGLEVGKDIDITITGLRPGEKLYEELLMNEEGLTATSHHKIFIGAPTFINFNSLLNSLSNLEKYMYSEYDLKIAMMHLVPTYHPTNYNSSILNTNSSLKASSFN